MTNVDPITGRLDQLSDTVYREQASGQLDRFLENWGKQLPVQKTQIYGLRQIARQQPRQIGKFAGHQRKRAERKLEMRGEDRRLEAEVAFWRLVAALCSSTSEWSVIVEGKSCLPHELREEAVPSKQPGISPEERRRRKELKQGRSNWLGLWTDAHVPAFFERFCTHALYRSEHLETP